MAEVGRARSMTALLEGGQHSAEKLDGLMGDLDLAGSKLAEFNASFEPTETGEAADAALDDAVDEDDIKIFCQARIEWKNTRAWRDRFREYLDELKAAEADPAPEDIE